MKHEHQRAARPGARVGQLHRQITSNQEGFAVDPRAELSVRSLYAMAKLSAIRNLHSGAPGY